MHTLVAYISGHGFGHASRTIELLREIQRRAPEVRLVVRSSIPRWLVERTAPPDLTLESLRCDTGAVQHDSLHLDVDETVRQAQTFTAELPALAAGEADVLARHGASVVLADIPALGVAAARLAGVPAVLLGNFTWTDLRRLSRRRRARRSARPPVR
ncbi:MAG: hypothetical protein R2712_02315 [Vicinamibacterales bacterium]